MQEITINGEKQKIKEQLSVKEWVDSLDLANQRYAIELNQAILPRSQYAHTILNEGDSIEIIHAVGGG